MLHRVLHQVMVILISNIHVCAIVRAVVWTKPSGVLTRFSLWLRLLANLSVFTYRGEEHCSHGAPHLEPCADCQDHQQGTLPATEVCFAKALKYSAVYSLVCDVTHFLCHSMLMSSPLSSHISFPISPTSLFPSHFSLDAFVSTSIFLSLSCLHCLCPRPFIFFQVTFGEFSDAESSTSGAPGQGGHSCALAWQRAWRACPILQQLPGWGLQYPLCAAPSWGEPRLLPQVCYCAQEVLHCLATGKAMCARVRSLYTCVRCNSEM